MIHEVVKWVPKRKLLSGRPRQKCLDKIQNDLNMLGINNSKQMAYDRERRGDSGKRPKWHVLSQKRGRREIMDI